MFGPQVRHPAAFAAMHPQSICGDTPGDDPLVVPCALPARDR